MAWISQIRLLSRCSISLKERGGGQFSDYVNRLNLAPVAISYELDPLDNLKGWELHHRDTRGEHKKRKGEDLISMVFGIKGQKGRIHYAFGSPLRGEFRNELDVAKAIDDFILANYRFWPTNYIAYDEINGTDRFRDHYTDAQAGQFLRRFKYLPSRVRNIVLRAYAAMLCHTLGEGVRVMEG